MKLTDIIEIVCKEYQLSPDTIQLKCRRELIKEARQICHYFAREYTNYSFREIGRFIGNLDYSTVINSCRIVDNFIFSDRKFRDMITRLRAQLTDIKKSDEYPGSWVDSLSAMVWDRWYFLKYRV